MKKLLAALLLSLVLNIAQAVDISSCQTLSVAGTVYTLTADVGQTGTCFTIDAANIVLDCQNHNVYGTGPAGTDGVRVSLNGNGAVVKNCRIGGYANGIYFLSAENGTFTNNTVFNTTGSGSGVVIALAAALAGTGFNISNNTINLASGYAIQITSNSQANITISGNVLKNSTLDLIYLYGEYNTTFTNNTMQRTSYSDSYAHFFYDVTGSIIVLNSTANLSTFRKAVGAANVSLNWYAEVRVLDFAGNPIANAHVNISNSTNPSTPFTRDLVTNAAGYTPRIAVMQFNGSVFDAYGAGGNTSFVPFNISTNGSTGTAYNSSNFTINSSGTFTLLANQLVASIVIATPANNTANTTLTVPFGFYANSSAAIKNASVWSNASGWSSLQSNTTNILNNTLNWVNATFPHSGQFKWAIQVCDTNSVCNSTSNFTLILMPPRLRINASDELLLTGLYFNVTVANATNSTTFTNQYWLNRTRSELPVGDLTITVSNHTCQTGLIIPRTYLTSFNETDVNVSTFLLCDTSSPRLVNFLAQSLAYQPLPNALVTANKTIAGGWQTVTSKKTDSSGTAALYLDTNTAYQISASLAGYGTWTGTITPSEYSYTITLSLTNATTGFQTMFDDLFYSIQPSNSYLCGNASNFSNVTFYINDSLALLNFWGWNITNDSSVQLYSLNSTAAGGGSDYATINMTLHRNVTILYWFSRSNFTTWTHNRTYYSDYTCGAAANDASLARNLGQPLRDGASRLLVTIIACVLVAFATTPFAKFVPQGAGIISLLLFAILTVVGLLPASIFAITAITYASYMAMMRVS